MISVIPRSPLLVAAAAVASLFSVRAASAQSVSACYAKTSGSMYRVGVANTPLNCTSGSHVKETWSIAGPAGPVGPAGATGATGPMGPAGPSGSLTLPYVSPVMTTASPLFWVKQTGTGRASTFESAGNSAIYARSTTNVGVHGYSLGVDENAAGVRAENLNTTGAALNIQKGAVRVTGAGFNTPTAAFKVNGVPVADITTVTIDNPMTNGDPDAILIVTRVSAPGDVAYRAVKGFYVFYDSGIAKWRIRFEYNFPIGTSYVAPGHAFNVLVIKN
ncbi:MAG TPA: hypothetical protein VE869_03330 [Gemmatimonas sp.]|nr:hypothetical protein [Gemmatimonas sp.]